MANVRKSSFQKREAVKRTLIKGTSPSIHNSQLIISSGIPSFDSLIGGGLPVGSLLLINEDEYATYAKLMLKYFMAEGIVSQHALFFAFDDMELKQMVNEIPSPINTEANDDDDYQGNDKKMAIAWRYENLKAYSHDRNKYFGHYFDLSKNINTEMINNSDITFFSEQNDMLSESFEDTIYYKLLKSIQKKLKDGVYFANEKNPERNILRIVLFHLNSPLWHSKSNSNSEKHLLTFLFSLRAFIRNAYATCCFTLPHSLRKNDLMKKCIHLADTAVQLESFAGTGCENVSPYKDYNGFFTIQKMAAINTLVTYNSQITNLAFKLKRKKFVIETFNLPPELEDTTERKEEESPLLSCMSSRSNKLDF